MDQRKQVNDMMKKSFTTYFVVGALCLGLTLGAAIGFGHMTDHGTLVLFVGICSVAYGLGIYANKKIEDDKKNGK